MLYSFARANFNFMADSGGFFDNVGSGPTGAFVTAVAAQISIADFGLLIKAIKIRLCIYDF